MHRLHTALLVGTLLLPLRALSAQGVEQMSVTGAQAPKSTKVARAVGFVFLGATWGQVTHSPELWPRTVSGYGQRLADGTGMVIVAQTTGSILSTRLDYRGDAVLCPRDRLVGCAVTATFTAFNRRGERRPNYPKLLGLTAGTAASLLWRPERRDNGESWSMALTRIGLGLGVGIAERIVLDGLVRRN
jgi:hypothetical protein